MGRQAHWSMQHSSMRQSSTPQTFAQHPPASNVSNGFLAQTALVFGRSFWPFFAIAVIAGAILWGPWVSLAITALAVTAALRLL
jgi:uncharacterized membrane protein YdjX (TVP38/TMEM64 family)